jgi:hypothetical protein
MRCNRFLTALAAGVLLAAGPAAHALTIVNFVPSPLSGGQSEFVYTGGATGQLTAGPGATGNGDGNLPLAQQTAGGLNIGVPFLVTDAGIGGKQVNAAAGSTTFFDVSLVLSGFAADMNAIDAAGQTFQHLGAGSFQLVSTNGVLLLSGTSTGATINALLAQPRNTAGAFATNNVTYTGGALAPFLDLSQKGGFSFAMVDVTPTVNTDPQTQRLGRFEANATGEFFGAAAVPVPSSVVAGGALLAGVVVVRRIRRHQSA